MIRAIILAAGAEKPIGNTSAYLAPVPPTQEPLIHRTQRQLKEAGVRDIRLVTTRGRINFPTTATIELVDAAPRVNSWVGHPSRNWVHEWEQSQHLWNKRGRTIILYGDTYYTDELMSWITTDKASEWHVWARWGASRFTGCDHGEMWAWVFQPEHHAVLTAAQQVAIAYKQYGLWDRCIGWEVYRIANGFLPWDHQIEDTHFCAWDDMTEDFDNETEYKTWLQNMEGNVT